MSKVHASKLDHVGSVFAPLPSWTTLAGGHFELEQSNMIFTFF
jgi:hypothetical protein